MKKLITICLLMATVFTVKAQQLTFEETVKYINNNLEKPNQIIADKSGNITVVKYNERFNFFDLDTNVVYYSTADKRELGLELETYNVSDGSKGYQITANVDKNNIALISHFNNQIVADRVFKALLHLRSLCTQIKDPFQN